MLRAPTDTLRADVSELQHQEAARKLRDYLTGERLHLLEACARAPDEMTVRRLQGAVLTLSDVLDLLKPRTP